MDLFHSSLVCLFYNKNINYLKIEFYLEFRYLQYLFLRWRYMNYWLLKSEPDTFGIEHLIASPKQTTTWDGVRNYQARNYLRQMKRGDQAFFYHSNCHEPGIVAVVKITKESYHDVTAFDPESKYYDPKSTSENPRWSVVEVTFVRLLKRLLTLKELKHTSELLSFPLLQKGNRLSIMPVSQDNWNIILQLENT